MLRSQTPTQKLRDKVNEGHDKKSVIQDEAIPGKTFKGALEADHIILFRWIELLGWMALGI